MTSYFDALRSDVRKASETAVDDADFLLTLEEIERPVIYDVRLIIDDREFPGDLRKEILDLFEKWQTRAAGGLSAAFARKRNLRSRQSGLCEKLHDAFHTVGRRRIVTRFGTLSDHPHINRMMREEYEKENHED